MDEGRDYKTFADTEDRIQANGESLSETHYSNAHHKVSFSLLNSPSVYPTNDTPRPDWVANEGDAFTSAQHIVSESVPLLLGSPALHPIRNLPLRNTSSIPGLQWKQNLLLISLISPAVVLWYISPPYSHLLPPAFKLLGVFLSLIGFLMLTEVSIGISVGVTLLGLCLTRTLACKSESGVYVQCSSSDEAFRVILEGFSEPVTWLIFAAFHLGFAIEKSGAAHVLSKWAMKVFGTSYWGQAAAIITFECVLGIFIPSNTARGGGLVLPMVLSMIQLSSPSETHTSSRSQFLILIGAHSNLLVSALFPTGAAPNPVVLAAAKSILHIEYSYISWIAASIVPFLVSCILVPYVLSHVLKLPSVPTVSPGFRRSESFCSIHSTATADELKVDRNKLVITALICTMTLFAWIFGPVLSIPEALTGLAAMFALVLTDIITWKDVISNSKAWDTYFWLSGMLVLADQMSCMGISSWLGKVCAHFIQDHVTTDPMLSAMCLAVLYFLSTCLFSSITAHAIAFVGPFMDASKELGCSPYLITALLASFSSLGSSLTHFGTGSLVLYFSQGHVSRRMWYLASLSLAFMYIMIALTIGMVWWKLLGYY